jgi:Domain of unknown function (DUF932)
MKTLPASALATVAAPTVSERYQFINSRDIVDRFAQEGWQVAQATVAAPRKRDPLFAKHMLDFRHPDFQEINGAVPRIILVNSHDGSSSARVLAGVFRFVCSNGLVVGNTAGREVVRHTGDAAADLIHRMQQLARNTSDLYNKIDRWSKIDLTKNQRLEFARFAAQLRWGDAQRFSPAELLDVRRAEDDRGDLWTTFNRVQENTVRGGIEGLSRSGRAATSRPLSDISRSVDYNAQLWQLAEEVAETW